MMAGTEGGYEQREWTNQTWPRKVHGNDLYIALAGIVLGILVGILFESRTGIPWGITGWIGLVLGFLLCEVGHQGMIKIEPAMVPPGHVALMIFRGNYTGEVAGPGPLKYPLWWQYELIDCRLVVREIGPLKIVSRDNLKIDATLRAGVRRVRALQSLEVEKSDDLIDSNLRAALHSSATSADALRIAGDSEGISERVRSSLNDRLTRYGFEVDYVDVAVLEIPEEIRGPVRAVAILKREYPEIDTSTHIDMVLADMGALRVSRTQVDVGPVVNDIVARVSKAYASG